ncbi:MAG: phosphoenolpyruvate carboxylase [Chloroflexota bacterium]
MNSEHPHHTGQPAGSPAPRAAPIDRLRDDVRLLGALVGDVLSEQGGVGLFNAVEHLRTATIALRTGSEATPAQYQALLQWVQKQSNNRLMQLVRAFSVYFHLINLAEQSHRVRTLSEREQTERPLQESVAAAVAACEEHGINLADLLAGLRKLEVWPVFTAHPSEARRRTLLQHLQRASSLIEELDNPQASPSAREMILDDLLTRITLIWQTAEARMERPTVLDEVRSVLYFLSGTLYDVAPNVQRSVEKAVDAYYSSKGTRPAEKAALPPVLRFGTWVGGDRDGNPTVTAEVTRASARMARSAILRRYRQDIQSLGRDLSVSVRLGGVSSRMMDTITHDLDELGQQPIRKWSDEPYRRKLGLIGERLRRTETGEPGSYSRSTDFLADLRQVEQSLSGHNGGRIARGPLRDLIWRVEIFGFHLAELEIRQHADRHTSAVAELLGLEGLSGFESLDPQSRMRHLEEILAGPPLDVSPDALSAPTREVLDTFRAMSDIQQLAGAEACRTYVVSMTRSPADVLAVLFLARQAGLYTWPGGEARAISRLDIVPLFEQVKELRTCDDILAQLLESPAYRDALASRGNRQQVMIGYSDSNKDGGYLASTWQTYQAQQLIAQVAAAHNVELVVFHGRGGAIGRGGGPMGRAIFARPPGARLPNLKVTEQGEVIFSRYGHPAIAQRHFEQMAHALLLSSLDSAEGAESPTPEWIATMERLAGASMERYETLVKRSPACLDFFRRVTPFPELGTLNIASRPVTRQKSGAGAAAIKLDDLRAIPWVFSWTQARINLPGWYGLGTALEAEIEAGGLETLRTMYREWNFFGMALNNAQRSLGTADMQVARLYSSLAGDDGGAVLAELREEYDRSVQTVLQVTQQEELLADSPILARSIKLRNPYVDALHMAQIALLQRYRALSDDAPEAERAALLDAIHHSINGIAAGLQTTG